jgi:hypothetical protein
MSTMFREAFLMTDSYAFIFTPQKITLGGFSHAPSIIHIVSRGQDIIDIRFIKIILNILQTVSLEFHLRSLIQIHNRLMQRSQNLTENPGLKHPLIDPQNLPVFDIET